MCVFNCLCLALRLLIYTYCRAQLPDHKAEFKRILGLSSRHYDILTTIPVSIFYPLQRAGFYCSRFSLHQTKILGLFEMLKICARLRRADLAMFIFLLYHNGARIKLKYPMHNWGRSDFSCVYYCPIYRFGAGSN